MSSILIVVVDGFRANALGAYGNTTFPTPALDQFSAQSFLLDDCFAQSPDFAQIYRALWQSIQPIRSGTESASLMTLPELLSKSGYNTMLVADDSELFSFTGANAFTQKVHLTTNKTPIKDRHAANNDETCIAQFFTMAADSIARVNSGQQNLVWVHSRGMYGTWDAPLSLQQSLLDESDPPPLESAIPPELCISKTDDPDVAFRYACAYAAQIMVLDECWQRLMEVLEASHETQDWLTMLVGARGFPLGEHRHVGGIDPRLYTEQLRVPWIIRFPEGSRRLCRTNRLVSHVDMLPTIADWIDTTSGISMPSEGMSLLSLAKTCKLNWREMLVSISDRHRAIRTAEWCLRQTDAAPANPDATPMPADELYVRPDDRWEANDVAKLCPDVIETLGQDGLNPAARRRVRPASR